MTQEAVGGLSNEGFWGVPVQAGLQYALSLYISSAQASSLCDQNLEDECYEAALIYTMSRHCGSAGTCSAGAPEQWSGHIYLHKHGQHLRDCIGACKMHDNHMAGQA